jgi:hypothetical protein
MIRSAFRTHLIPPYRVALWREHDADGLYYGLGLAYWRRYEGRRWRKVTPTTVPEEMQAAMHARLREEGRPWLFSVHRAGSDPWERFLGDRTPGGGRGEGEHDRPHWGLDADGEWFALLPA